MEIDGLAGLSTFQSCVQKEREIMEDRGVESLAVASCGSPRTRYGGERLREELCAVQVILNSSKKQVEESTQEVVKQRNLNSELKGLTMQRVKEALVDGNVTPKKLQLADLENENSELKMTVDKLELQLSERSSRSLQEPNLRCFQLDEGSLSQKMTEAGVINKVLRAQWRELQSLKKLNIVFEEENARLIQLSKNKIEPCSTELDNLKMNLVRIGTLITAILSERKSMAETFCELKDHINKISEENEYLKNINMKLSKKRNIHEENCVKMSYLIEENLRLKQTIDESSSSGAELECLQKLESESSRIIKEIDQIKSLLINLSTTQTKPLSCRSTEAKENYHPLQEKFSSSGKDKSNQNYTPKKAAVETNISERELAKLGQKLDQFGEYNKEFEFVIGKLKEKLKNNGQYDSQNYNSNNQFTSANNYSSLQPSEIHYLVMEMKRNLNILHQKSQQGDESSTKMISYIQNILELPRATTAAEHHLTQRIQTLTAELHQAQLITQTHESNLRSLMHQNDLLKSTLHSLSAQLTSARKRGGGGLGCQSTSRTTHSAVQTSAREIHWTSTDASFEERMERKEMKESGVSSEDEIRLIEVRYENYGVTEGSLASSSFQ